MTFESHIDMDKSETQLTRDQLNTIWIARDLHTFYKVLSSKTGGKLNLFQIIDKVLRNEMERLKSIDLQEFLNQNKIVNR